MYSLQYIQDKFMQSNYSMVFDGLSAIKNWTHWLILKLLELTQPTVEETLYFNL